MSQRNSQQYPYRQSNKNRSLFICIREYGKDLDLPPDTELMELFHAHASKIQEASILDDKTRQTCKRFGKVTFESIKDASKAVQDFQGAQARLPHGKRLLVRYWRETDTPATPKSGSPVTNKPLCSFRMTRPASYGNVKNATTNPKRDDLDQDSRTLFIIINKSKFPNVERISDRAFKAHFQGFQHVIQNAFIVSDRETKEQKNFGFITFASREDAAAALEIFKVLN